MLGSITAALIRIHPHSKPHQIRRWFTTLRLWLLVMRDPKLLTTDQVVEKTGFSKRALEEWRKTGDRRKPPFIRYGTGPKARVYYHADFLQPGSYTEGGEVQVFGATKADRNLKPILGSRSPQELAEEEAAYAAQGAAFCSAAYEYEWYEMVDGKQVGRISVGITAPRRPNSSGE
jgi:hypothetical protein